MSPRLTETTFRAWLRLLRAQQVAMARVEADLKQAGLPPLPWYDALLELEHAGDGGLRPSELEKELMLPQYGLSRLLDRIEADGYLKRQPLPGDRRGQVVVITEAGRDLRRRMWPIYADAVASAFGSPLSENEAATLDRLLAQVIAG